MGITDVKESETENIAVRLGTEKDIDSILRIQKEDGYPHAYYLTAQRVRRLLKKGQVIYVALEEDGAIAFSIVDFDVRAWIHFLSVIKDEQRKGIGLSLVNEIIKESQNRGINLVYIIPEQDAEKIDGFLRNYGFIKRGYHKDRFGPGRNGIIWNFHVC